MNSSHPSRPPSQGLRKPSAEPGNNFTGPGRFPSIYKRLSRHFGPQGWWPIGGRYAARKRLTERERWEICAGALLTQNTAWTNVERALENLRTKKALALAKLGSLPKKRLAGLIRSAGYFNQKAARLIHFARWVLKRCRGKLSRFFSGSLDKIRGELLAINGIGPETADSMLLYAGGRSVFVVDAYTRRIFTRLKLIRSQEYETVRGFFESSLPKSARLFNEFHALIVALGKDICRKKPLCHICPLMNICPTGKAVA